MPQTCILVDLENVQLKVADLAGLVRGEHQLKIFHGPSQNKVGLDLVMALQPLGDAVEYIQCEKAGPNALDFHLAFHLGRLTLQHPDLRIQIVSRDKGFAQLVSHANRLGHHVSQHASLPLATGPTATASASAGAKTAPAKKAAAAKRVSAKQAAPAPASAPTPVPVKKVAVKKAVAAKKVVAKKAAAKVAAKRATPPATKELKPAKPAPQPDAAPKSGAKAVRDVADAGDRSKAIASLQRMGEKRPTSVKALTHHLQSHLRTDLSDSAVESLVQGLMAAGLIAMSGRKLVYQLNA
ncbi:MAG: PIN domain-containing protein [Leptothrix sp. (in: b-proteobacteria)]